MPDELNLDQINELAFSFWQSRILLSAVELNLFGAVGEEERTPAEVADLAKMDQRAARILMRALAGMGLLYTKDGKFRNTATTTQYLLPDQPDYIGTALLHSSNLWLGWSHLTEVACSGQPYEVEGPGIGNVVESFIMAMHKRALTRAPLTAKALNLNGVKRLLDLGGGPGTHAVAFAWEQPGLQAVVFDRPQVTPIAQRVIREAKLEDRITTQVGDYFKHDFGRNFDMVFMSAIIHANSPEQNGVIFAKAARALNPGGRLAVVDFIMNEDHTEPRFGALFAVNMLTGTRGGDTYSGDEVRSWMEATGYTDISGPTRIYEEISLMTAVKPR